MQVVLSAILSHLYYMLEDWHMFTDTLVHWTGAKYFTSFLIFTCVPFGPLALNLPMKSHLLSGRSAKQFSLLM